MVEPWAALYIALSGLMLGLRHRRQPREWALRWLIVSALPVVGWLYPPLWPFPKRRADAGAGEGLFEEPEEPPLRRSALYAAPETDRELGVVPVEEALVVGDYASRRQAMIDVLKQDSMQYMDILKKAIGNEDGETSHYAVSAVMEVKRKLALSLQELSVRYEENKEDPRLLQTYADVLRGYMDSGFLDERTLLKYKYTRMAVLEQLIVVAPDAETAYAEKADAELGLGRFADAERTALLYAERFPLSEESYLTLIKVYYEARAYEKLQAALDSLKRSPLRLSNRGLTVVRFWSEGA